jgi:hypothetical protein
MHKLPTRSLAADPFPLIYGLQVVLVAACFDIFINCLWLELGACARCRSWEAERGCERERCRLVTSPFAGAISRGKTAIAGRSASSLSSCADIFFDDSGAPLTNRWPRTRHKRQNTVYQ